MTTDRRSHALSRRHALTGAATVGLGAPLLAACGDDPAGETASDPSSSASSPEASGGGNGRGSANGGGADALASTSDIEVGGGTIFADEEVVITQPTDGDFRGFSSTCTHQGCQVAEVTDGSIHCPCHDSMFSIEDGSVLSGPATEALPPVEITVQGDSITLA